MIRDVYQTIDDSARMGLDHQLCLSAKRIYITGCGDSHHAALGAELAFEAITGLPTEALPSLQFARYAAPYLPKTEPGTNLVIGISVSGEVSRTLEALQQGKQYGATVVSLTATPESRIGKAGDTLINTTTPAFPDPEGVHTPGVRSYTANQLGLYLSAIRIGEVRGRITTAEANNLRKELLSLADVAEETLQANKKPARELAEKWKDAQEFVYVGAGPNFATALFSAAKLLEASGDPALGQETEEWAHLQYFAREVNTPTFVITNAGRDLTRANEVLVAGKTVGRRVAAVAPHTAADLHQSADYSLFLPDGVREMFSPVVACIPTELFAAFRSEVLGEPFFRGFGGGRSQEGGGGISRIRTSQILESEG
jgi:glucosamine--fructose-6-phosphate aminotransferase (isomerizing)